MTNALPDDILLPSDATRQGSSAIRFAAFVPISVAVAGVVAVLLGGIAAREPIDLAGQTDVDPVITGSITKPLAASPGEVTHGR